MRVTNTLFFLIATSIISFKLYAQDPNIEWQNTIGGSDTDHVYDIHQTNGGYIVTGVSNSPISGDKTEASNGETDIWILKIDENGNILWQNSIGGNSNDDSHSVVEADDGGFIIVGESDSNISGDKTENSRGVDDFWIVKISEDGNVEWDKTYGGSSIDWIPKIVASANGTFFVGGISLSDISGDKTETKYGSNDIWLLKIDSDGNLLWQDTIGGLGSDELWGLDSTSDGGCIIGAISDSDASIDKTEDSRGETDYWIVKLDVAGAIEWDKTIGGNGPDSLYSIIQTSDGGYLVGGYSSSNISGDKTENSEGESDYWIIKLDNDGDIEWQNTIGGSDAERYTTVVETADGSFLVGGASSSNASGDKTENSLGGNDYWVLKINYLGIIERQNTIGGSENDYLRSLIQSNDEGFVLAGNSLSNISGDKTEDSQGESDYWILKLNNVLGLSENKLSSNLTLYPNPAKNTLQLNVDNHQIDLVKIFSVKGDLVQQIESFETSKTIDVSHLSSGMYYVQFTAGKQIATKKFVKE